LGQGADDDRHLGPGGLLRVGFPEPIELAVAHRLAVLDQLGDLAGAEVEDRRTDAGRGAGEQETEGHAKLA